MKTTSLWIAAVALLMTVLACRQPTGRVTGASDHDTAALTTAQAELAAEHRQIDPLFEVQLQTVVARDRARLARCTGMVGEAGAACRTESQRQYEAERRQIEQLRNQRQTTALIFKS